jgi:hypothetical protein
LSDKSKSAVVAVVIAITAAHVAALTSLFEIVAVLLRLTAALSVLLDGLLQAFLGSMHVAAAAVVVVAIGVCRQSARGEKRDCQGRGQGKILKSHADLLR